MRLWFAFVALIAGASVAQQPDPSGFISLFNGKDLSGWRGRPQLDPNTERSMDPQELATSQLAWDKDVAQHWRVENGEIKNDGHGVFLTTARDFGDFELHLEYNTVAKADSGIYLRGHPQVQIWDTTEEGGKWNLGADKGSGGLWNNKKSARFPDQHADRPFGAWNQLRILMVGARTSVWLNGHLVVNHVSLENFFDPTAPLPALGPIQLQTHGGEIRFRHLALREIGPAEANWILGSRGSDGFRAIFNGKDLTGWKGPVDQYMVEDAAIVCRPKKGGTIFFEQELSNFDARIEFLLPPAGNNGLAIRYPGEGDTAYVGMTELQILDDTAEKYKDLKPWQSHGSAYGLVPAHRGYLRPTGTWNFQEVRVHGSRITVELNGTFILDTDLSTIETPPSGKDHPGRTRTRGHFGFAGHGDPVRFRSVSLRTGE